VLLAEDGFDALSKVNDHDPDLIFCDILDAAPGRYQTLPIIKRNSKFTGVPVIMLSSKDGCSTRREAAWSARGISHQAIYQGPAPASRRAAPARV